MDKKSVILKIAITIGIAVALILIVIFIVQFSKPQGNVILDITEIEDGIYAYRENVVSAIPAQNYSMITFSDVQGNIYTVKGKVKIRTCEESPFVIWTMYNIVNSDEVTIYVPSGGVKYIGTVSVGYRR